MTTNLEALPGVVIRQESQWAEMAAQAFGLPFEARNKYKVAALPFGKRAARDHNASPEKWAPSGEELQALPELMRVQEESSCLVRCVLACCGCLNLRPLTLHYSDAGGEKFRVERKFNLGAWICCPLKMTLLELPGAKRVGEIVEDFQPYCGR
jgi:hypothetical protein